MAPGGMFDDLCVMFRLHFTFFPQVCQCQNSIISISYYNLKKCINSNHCSRGGVITICPSFGSTPAQTHLPINTKFRKTHQSQTELDYTTILIQIPHRHVNIVNFNKNMSLRVGGTLA